MARIWIDTGANPFALPEPPTWWQDLVYDYDKMLRIFPSQKDRCYRLGRLVRRESRLGLQAMGEVHKHPDTVMMIRFGLVPVSTVFPWATTSTKILRDLRARDGWRFTKAGMLDPDAIVKTIEDNEQAAADALARQGADDLDRRSADTFRSVQVAKGERAMLAESLRGRRGKTGATDKTRVQVAMSKNRQYAVPDNPNSRAPGVPSRKVSDSNGGIVLTDAR